MAEQQKYIYFRSGHANIFVDGQNRACGSVASKHGPGLHVVRDTPQVRAEIDFYAKEGLCVLLPGRPNYARLEQYDRRRPWRGRAKTEIGRCAGHEADGSPCRFEPEKGERYCFRHLTRGF